jgi:enoyl-CoA hydratase/carnithine racemase
VPDSGGTWLLPQLVGNARAMGLAMLGDKLTADQAVEWGLIGARRRRSFRRPLMRLRAN